MCPIAVLNAESHCCVWTLSPENFTSPLKLSLTCLSEVEGDRVLGQWTKKAGPRPLIASCLPRAPSSHSCKLVSPLAEASHPFLPNRIPTLFQLETSAQHKPQRKYLLFSLSFPTLSVTHSHIRQALHFNRLFYSAIFPILFTSSY